MKITKKRTENGQSLILVTLLLIAFFAMLALLIDGGMTYWHRRNAQNAADAGAIAGAEVLCRTRGNTTQAHDTAIEYAITRNGATTANASATWLDPGGTVYVQTNINFQTFFGRLFGQNTIDAPADATAGCAPPAGVGVMPVAWSCKAPIGVPNPTYCEVLYMDDPLYEDVPDGQCTWGDDPMYIIADSDDITDDIVCNDVVICDLDGDGVNEVEILGGGDRSWLDLNGGGGGAAELKDWVEGDYANLAISPHDWVAAQTGVTVAVYDAVHDNILQKDVVVPVFDSVHPDGPPPVDWPHAGLDDIIGNEPHDYFHIASFSYWRTTCVDAGSHGPCPARIALNTILINAGYNPGHVNSMTSMEGCFVEGSVGGIGGEPGQGVDAGVYTVFLMD